MKAAPLRGTELCYEERGAGTPLVLVHAFPLDQSMWAAQLDGLSSRCRVIAPDLRGFGCSPAVDDKVTMEEFADDIAALLETLQITEPAVICGLSMGGYVALQFWRRHRARLRGLVLCDTRAAADAPATAAARLQTADQVLREGSRILVDAMLPRLLADSTRQQHPELLERVRAMIMAAEPRGVAAAARGMAERPDMTDALAEITCPTLVLVGQDDVISPPDEMRALAQAIPNAAFVDVKNAGHLAPLENPGEVNAALLAFLGPLRDV